MSKQFLYLVGIPGSGKTTLLRAVLGGRCAVEQDEPLKHVEYLTISSPPQVLGIQLGVARVNGFGGTDALPMNVQPIATRWLTGQCPHETVIAEGDRLANTKFFNALREAGWDLTVAFLDCPYELAAERRRQRGSNQSATWLKGRQSKVERLAGQLAHPQWFLDATQPVSILAEKLAEHPAVRIIQGRE